MKSIAKVVLINIICLAIYRILGFERTVITLLATITYLIISEKK